MIANNTKRLVRLMEESAESRKRADALMEQVAGPLMGPTRALSSAPAQVGTLPEECFHVDNEGPSPNLVQKHKGEFSYSLVGEGVYEMTGTCVYCGATMTGLVDMG